jgi:hypothetical protein
MKENLIDLETAKLAKDKGYKIQLYGKKNKEPYMQSALQKWLREKHNIFVQIHLDQTSSPKFCYSIHKYNKETTEWINLMEPMQYSDLYRESEDALDDGLQEALKLL